jgi:hypothetical protein
VWCNDLHSLRAPGIPLALFYAYIHTHSTKRSNQGKRLGETWEICR